MRRFTKGKKSTKEQQQEAFAENLVLMLSIDPGVRVKAQKKFSELYQSLKGNLGFHSSELHSAHAGGEIKLFPDEIIRGQQIHVLAQLVGLNATEIIGKIFADDMKGYPDIKQAVLMIFQTMLDSYSIDLVDQSAVYNNLFAIFQKIKGDDNSKTRAHFDKQFRDPNLQTSLRALFYERYMCAVKEANVEQMPAVIKFWKKMYGYIEVIDGDNLNFLPVEEGKRGQNQEALQAALRKFYFDIVDAKLKNSPTLPALLALLNLVRGAKGSIARTAFNAMWDYAAFSQEIVKKLQKYFEAALLTMVNESNVEGLSFWTGLLETIPATSAVAKGFFIKVFAKDKITVQETVEEGSGNEIYQVMTGREIVYSGWAMLLSQRFAFDWSKINLPLLLNAIKWGAPIGSAKQAPLVRSLVDAIKAEAEEEKANEYLDILCQLLAAVRRVEADYICNGLYQADILNRVVQRAQIKPHSQALISILRTDFSSEVLGSLYKDIQGNAKGLVVILGLVNESPEVFSSILSEIHRQKKWDVIKAVVIDTLNVNVLYGLQMLEYKVLYKKQSYPGLADFDLSLQAMERLMEALYARAGSGANLLFDQVMPDQSRDSNSFVLSQFRGRAASIVATNSSDDDWSSHDDVTDMQQLQSFIRDQQWVQFIALLGSSQEDLDLIQIKKWLETANYKQTCEQSQQIDDALAQAPRKQELRNSLKRAKKASQHGRRQVPALPCVDEVIAHKAYCKDITIEQIGRQLRAIGNFGSYLFAAIGEQIMLYVLLRDDAIGEYSITTRGLSTEITVDEEDGGKLAVNAIAGENTLAAFLENNKSILRLPVSQEKVIYEGGCSDDDELPEPPTAAKPDSSATMQALYKQPVKRGNGLIGKDSSSLLGGKSPALPPRQTAEPNPAEAPSSTA